MYFGAQSEKDRIEWMEVIRLGMSREDMFLVAECQSVRRIIVPLGEPWCMYVCTYECNLDTYHNFAGFDPCMHAITITRYTHICRGPHTAVWFIVQCIYK